MVHKIHSRKLNQIVHHIFPLTLLIILFVIAGSSIVVYQKNATPSSLTTPTPTPIPAPITTYTSDTLGISFTYRTRVGGKQNFYTREIGNTVYLYYNRASNQEFSGTDEEFLKTIPGSGFSVEVFNKDPQQSLTNAIKKQFLTGYAENDCPVKNTHKGHPRKDESYETAIIDFPHISTDTRKQIDIKLAKCPKKYVVASGIGYFLMDPKHPDKFLFVKVGQYNISSGEGYSWDKTIKIFK